MKCAMDGKPFSNNLAFLTAASRVNRADQKDYKIVQNVFISKTKLTPESRNYSQPTESTLQSLYLSLNFGSFSYAVYPFKVST